MPYYVHHRDHPPTQQPGALDVDSGPDVRLFTLKAAAVAARVGDQCITFVATYREQRAWQDREYARLQYGPEDGTDSGTYHKLPFTTPHLHYAHHAKGHPGKIAYTPDDTYGHEDRQLVVTAGRYLERHGAECCVTPEDHARLIGMVKIIGEPLRFASDADTIEQVYCAPNGPTSCMDDRNDFDSDVHPVRAYAGGDLQVAYIGELPDTVAARAVVWPAVKKYVRVYGDAHTMLAALTAAGYTKVSNLNGAKLRAIKQDDNSYVLPYIDGSGGANLSKCGKFIVLDYNGTLCTSNTSGVSRTQDHYCCAPGCDEPCDPDEHYCGSCDEARWTCERCNDESFSDDDHYSTTDEILCETCYNESRKTCEACGDRFNPLEWTARTRRNHNDDNLCDSCDGEWSMCTSCDTYVENSDLKQHGGEGDEICKACRAAESHRRKARRQGVVMRKVTATDDLSNPTITLSANYFYCITSELERIPTNATR